MTVTAKATIKDGCLMVRGNVVLTGVPQNVVVSPSSFIGATSAAPPSSRHVFTLGVLPEFKIWWMIPRVGKSASEVPMETQMLLLEAREDSPLDADAASDNTFYILLLPVLDGQFRATLQGTPTNDLQFCVESGDSSVQTSEAFEAVFINSGDNPFELIKDSIKILEKHKRTFSHLENKKIPRHLDWFGWCTWDAFYKQVNPQGIKEGLHSFLEGGCSPRFLVIDDGWQETINEFCKDGEPLIKGTQFTIRLVDIKENCKFNSSGSDNSCNDLHEFIDEIKEKYGLKYVYMWHALAGYWGGVLPSSDIMKKDIAMDSLEKYGVGIIDPQKIFDFYNDLHSYLASSGVDGVKVDVQSLMETLGSGYGGRVLLTRQYQQALEQSVAWNFKDNNLICCMSHNSDSLYSSMKSAVARASEDFMPGEPTFQTLHIASVAFNSLLLGEIVVPDWDMFQSKHETAEFHATARALGGCAVYVSDKPGVHDFKILKRLVLPDGSVLRARHAGRPTRDCLFEDPVMDGKRFGILNKIIWRACEVGPMKEDMHSKPASPLSISGHAVSLILNFLRRVAGENWNGDCCSEFLLNCQRKENLEVFLATLKCRNIYNLPIQRRLLDMYKTQEEPENLSTYIMDLSKYVIKIKAKACEGCGRFAKSDHYTAEFYAAARALGGCHSPENLELEQIIGDCRSLQLPKGRILASNT
ncbi:hypothetical protein CUMW_103210, partial [Citrus unshiu]